MHRVPVDEVHFHEVGALDALADIVGVTAGFAHLGLTALDCSTLSLGSGTTRGAHGPAPRPRARRPRAAARVCPSQAGPAPYESTTPTGAALLATLVTDWGPLPPMPSHRTGYGAGGRDPEEVANVLRLVVGDPLGRTGDRGAAGDQRRRPRPAAVAATCWPQLMDAGASDAWLTPILMKKGRPAHTLSVLCTADQASARAGGGVPRDVHHRAARARRSASTRWSAPRARSTSTVSRSGSRPAGATGSRQPHARVGRRAGGRHGPRPAGQGRAGQASRPSGAEASMLRAPERGATSASRALRRRDLRETLPVTTPRSACRACSTAPWPRAAATARCTPHRSTGGTGS